jgi:hypothetical protein
LDTHGFKLFNRTGPQLTNANCYIQPFDSFTRANPIYPALPKTFSYAPNSHISVQRNASRKWKWSNTQKWATWMPSVSEWVPSTWDRVFPTLLVIASWFNPRPLYISPIWPWEFVIFFLQFSLKLPFFWNIFPLIIVRIKIIKNTTRHRYK